MRKSSKFIFECACSGFQIDIVCGYFPQYTIRGLKVVELISRSAIRNLSQSDGDCDDFWKNISWDYDDILDFPSRVSDGSAASHS